ncbi:MAG: alpha/beta hydrolase [Litoreibacter sp.]|nr:alpha/beta hydrolase [Litoreibacter sp.]
MMSTTQPLSKGHFSYTERGHGEPLMLIHGVGMNARAWGPQMDALMQNYRVIAVDMPGHGGSTALPRGSQLPQFVAWTKEVVEALKLGSVNIAGHSMGALIAAGFACTAPHAARRVALLNPVFRRSATARAAVKARADEIAKGTFDLETPLARWFSDSPAEAQAKALTGQLLSEVSAGGYATAYAAFAAGDATYADQIAQIHAPLLALTADGDKNSTPEMSRAIANLAPLGRAEIITGHRHMVNLTAPHEVNAALLQWLKCPTTQEALP